MPDAPSNPTDLSGIYGERMAHHAPRFAAMNEVEDAVRGRLPKKFEKLWAKDDHTRMEIRTIKMADDDLTAMTAKVFPISVDPYSEHQNKKDGAERVEKIAYGWNNGSAMVGGVEMDGIMYQLARHQVRFADGCLAVLPDYENKLVFMEVRDPRTHLPPVGWHPWTRTPLDGTLIAYRETLGNLKRKYPHAAEALNRQYRRSRFGFGKKTIPGDSTICNVGEYYSRDAWYFSTLDTGSVTLAGSEQGDRMHPGVCGIVSFMQFETDPMFAGQVGIEVALNKVLSQQIQGTDEMLHGPIFASPLVGRDIDWDGLNIFKTSAGEKPFVQRLAPSSPMNTERVLGSLMGFARVLNRNPESFQGSGDANSAKAIQTLQSGIRSTVQDILWRPFIVGFPRVYDNCLGLELNLWPNEKKKAYGTRDNVSYEVDYTPSVHLDGYKGRIRIEVGFGLGGYHAQLEAMQRHDAGTLPLEDMLERDPSVRDVQGTLRRIEMESIGKLADAIFEAKAPQIALAGLSRIIQLISEGKTKLEAYQIAEQEGVLMEQAPPEMGPGPPQLPPGLALPPGMALPPSLAGARGEF